MTIRIECNILVSNLCGGRPDREELFCLERSATDQSAINIRHAEQFGSISCLAASPVEEAQAGGDTSIVRRHPPADKRMRILRLLRCSRPARADRPYRLIGNDG